MTNVPMTDLIPFVDAQLFLLCFRFGGEYTSRTTKRS